jgi:hypothetical protein
MNKSQVRDPRQDLTEHELCFSDEPGLSEIAEGNDVLGSQRPIDLTAAGDDEVSLRATGASIGMAVVAPSLIPILRGHKTWVDNRATRPSSALRCHHPIEPLASVGSDAVSADVVPQCSPLPGRLPLADEHFRGHGLRWSSQRIVSSSVANEHGCGHLPAPRPTQASSAFTTAGRFE